MDERVPDLLPARMIAEYAYCPRLFHLEWVQTEWADSVDTIEGRSGHRRVDVETGSLAPPDELLEATDREGVESRVTSLMLSAPKLGAITRLDLLEVRHGVAVPIDYKKGPKPDIPEGMYEPQRVQLCVQGLALRENGYRCDYAESYFIESKTRVRVDLDDALVARTYELAAKAREAAASPEIPPPLMDSPKCPRCSLVGICLPDEVNFLRAIPAEVSPDDVRRLTPVRDDRSPLYLQTQGLSLGKDGEVVQVREKGRVVREVRLNDISQVNIYGNIQASTQLIHEFLRRDVPMCYFSYGGWFNGLTHSLGSRNIEQRRRQYRAAEDTAVSLRLAQRFVRGKILNGRTLLRRNSKELPPSVLREMTRLAFTAGRVKDRASLLGIEGAAARLYFARFGALLRPPGGDELGAFDFDGRNRRPPLDPVNALLSFLYAVLAKDLTVTALAVGLEPYLGFFHQPRFGRPSLALDLMEEFRPLIADSVVLQLINTGEIRAEDFLRRAGFCALTSTGRKRVLDAYERRMDTSVIHPLFGYSASYRRVLEIQCRLVGRFLAGEIPEYPPFRTR